MSSSLNTTFDCFSFMQAKIVASLLIIVLLVSLVGIAVGFMPIDYFWLVIILAGLFAYFVVPNMKGGSNNR